MLEFDVSWVATKHRTEHSDRQTDCDSLCSYHPIANGFHSRQFFFLFIIFCFNIFFSTSFSFHFSIASGKKRNLQYISNNGIRWNSAARLLKVKVTSAAYHSEFFRIFFFVFGKNSVYIREHRHKLFMYIWIYEEKKFFFTNLFWDYMLNTIKKTQMRLNSFLNLHGCVCISTFTYIFWSQRKKNITYKKTNFLFNMMYYRRNFHFAQNKVAVRLTYFPFLNLNQACLNLIKYEVLVFRLQKVFHYFDVKLKKGISK